MIKQYPHYLFAINATSESEQDENGNWIEKESTPFFSSACREETNGSGSQIQTAGGKFHVFASLIQLPKDAPKIEAGTIVFISNDAEGEDKRIEGSVLRFDQTQLHSRIWL